MSRDLEPVTFDLRGDTPIPRGQFWLAIAMLALLVVGLSLATLLINPSPTKGKAVVSRLDAVEAKVDTVRKEQEALTAEQARLREEMARGFAELRAAVEKRQ